MAISAGTAFSHYKILSSLGAGGMGEVWLAEDTRLKRKVALKLLPAELTTDADRVRRFEQEAQAASALNHPNIVTVHDIGESESGRFIVMELVEGRTLRQIRQEDNSVEMLKSLGAQMAKALGAAHAAGITHRDIKPENIMVREDGYVKILDFGLARLLPAAAADTEAATLARQTMPGQLLGTVAYMSPEQARGEAVGPASDIFSLGIVFYEMATGRHPFQSETLVGYLHAITGQTPPPPSQLKPDLPSALNALIPRMLEKEANQRPTASEVAQALQAMERGGDGARVQSVESQTVILPSAGSGTASADEGFWVAVLPFKWRGANAELEALAEGLSEDIVTGLSRFSYLRVIARSSTMRFTGETSDVRAIGKELGARYVMEGSLRQAGSTLRVAVQVVDASTGAHLWAETYNRAFSPDAVFEIQDDLVPRIVSSCADHFGVLARSISEAVRWKEPGQLSPYEALMRGFGYHFRLSPHEHAMAREALERAVEQAPNNADCWAMLSWVYSHEHGHGFNPRPGSLDRALAAAQRAVDLAPSNHLAYQTLAVAYFFRKDKAACLSAAERAMALNPLDTSNEAIFLIAFTGDWERGCALIERARELNPHHPGWYWWVLAVNEYRRQNYQAVIDGAVKANSPGIFWTNMLLAAAYGQLGEFEAARDALRNLRSQYEDFAASAREVLGKWFEADLVEHLIEGLRKAGMQFAETGRKIAGTGEKNSSSPRPASPDPSIVVLPFTNTSTDAENDYFCDGLTEELISDLSQIRSLRVISRNSAMRLKGTKKELKTISEELNVRYVLDGSVRKAGQNFRISVQLIDGITDANLWAEKYSGSLDDIFDIQESVSRSIAEALKIKLTAGEIEQIRERPIADARAYDLYLQAREKLMQGNPAALDRSIELLKQGLEIIGENELLYAALGYSYYFYFKWISKLDENYLRLANECLQKTFAVNPTSTHGFSLKGFLSYSEGNVAEAVRSLKQAVEIEPTNAEALLWLTIYSQYFENNLAEALKYADEVRRIDPLLPVNTLVRGFVKIYSGDFGAEPLAWIERGFEMDTSAPLSNWLAAIGKAWCGKTAWNGAASCRPSRSPRSSPARR